VGWLNREFSLSETAAIVQEYIDAALADAPKLMA
jgi:hypothetical protein